MSTPLEAELSHHVYLREQLRAQFPDESEENLADTLDGLTNLREMLAAVIRSTDEDMAMIGGLSDRIEELNNRGTRLEHRVEMKRALVARVMERAGLQKIVAYDATISLSHRQPQVMVIDASLIPAAYKSVPKTPEPVPNKPAIKEALNAGLTVPGATLGNGSVSIVVRKL